MFLQPLSIIAKNGGFNRMESIKNLSNGEILSLCVLIFIGILIFPRLMRRRRIAKTIYAKKRRGEALSPEDFSGKTKLLLSHNAPHTEVEELLVKLKKYAFKHNMKIVFPGSIRIQQQISPTTMILVGSFGILLIRCYGFGGHIFVDPDSGNWKQQMNEQQKEIPSPLLSMEKERGLMETALKEQNLPQAPIFTASVFTRRDVLLNVPTSLHVFDRVSFLQWLKEDPLFFEDRSLSVSEITRTLVELVRS